MPIVQLNSKLGVWKRVRDDPFLFDGFLLSHMYDLAPQRIYEKVTRAIKRHAAGFRR